MSKRYNQVLREIYDLWNMTIVVLRMTRMIDFGSYILQLFQLQYRVDS